jgi:hypothetical protein
MSQKQFSASEVKELRDIINTQRETIKAREEAMELYRERAGVLRDELIAALDENRRLNKEVFALGKEKTGTGRSVIDEEGQSHVLQ